MSRRPENHPDSVLAVRRLNKSFGEIQVLFGVDFDVKAGEMHALLGENGAGKSTLVKVLSGFLEPTSGHVLLDGKTVTLPPNGQAEKLGIVLIHQEFNLAEQQTVEENMFLGREITRGGLLDKKTMRARCAEVLETLQCPIDPTTRVSDLSVSDKQMVEIAKALSRDARVLIMDEPTAVLTGEESKALFEQVKRLKAAGVAVIFISHKLDEIKAEADRVTVLRDGQWIATKPVDELTQDGMARLMVGRELSDMFPPKNEPDVDAPIVLKADGIRVPGAVRQASFELREGEILGFAGLIGSGRTAVFEALLGLRPMAAGTVEVNGQPTRLKSLAQAADRRIAYLTKDRKGKGLLVGMQLRPNLTLLALRQFVRSLLIDEKSEQKALDKAIRRFDIRARDRKALVGELSGGNQQKLLLGKVMEIDPEIIIVDEPTRGIDVGTKQQIYHFIAALAAEGKSIVLISSEMLEIIGMSHRVAVMHAGQLTGVLEGDAIEEHEIMRYAAGLKGNQDNEQLVA